MLKLNDGKHITHIVATVPCGQHQAPRGSACWAVETQVIDTDFSERQAYAVCGSRIRKAGYNGKISPTSVQMKRASR